MIKKCAECGRLRVVDPVGLCLDCINKQLQELESEAQVDASPTYEATPALCRVCGKVATVLCGPPGSNLCLVCFNKQIESLPDSGPMLKLTAHGTVVGAPNPMFAAPNPALLDDVLEALHNASAPAKIQALLDEADVDPWPKWKKHPPMRSRTKSARAVASYSATTGAIVQDCPHCTEVHEGRTFSRLVRCDPTAIGWIGDCPRCGACIHVPYESARFTEVVVYGQRIKL